MKRIIAAVAISLTTVSATQAQTARSYISVVGSSTVYPFSTVVAEQFGKTTSFKTPKVESTGSGGGLKLFCSGIGVNHPDITNASRRIKGSEVKKCAGNGVKEIVEVDAEHRIVWSNASAEPLLGVRLETDTGQPIDNLVRHPQFIEYLRDGQSSDTLTIPSPADPDRLVTVRVMPYGETQSVVLARDDTERTRLERMREDFISNVSHELKTPLTVLGGYVETMEDAGQDLPERWQRPTKAMSEQVVRMSRLVEDLLLLARLESTERPSEEHPVDVPALLEGLMEEARILSGAANHELTLEATPGLWLHANPAELRAAFSNLVANAIHYTPASGRISVRWHTDGRTAFFEVEDSGEGIDKQHLGRLTERFYRADPGRARAHGGTGLGLAIVKHALQHYDAVLEIQSTIGAGSEFRCRFPAERTLRATEHPVSA